MHTLLHIWTNQIETWKIQIREALNSLECRITDGARVLPHRSLVHHPPAVHKQKNVVDFIFGCLQKEDKPV